LTASQQNPFKIDEGGADDDEHVKLIKSLPSFKGAENRRGISQGSMQKKEDKSDD
jgi:hypothetical protein